MGEERDQRRAGRIVVRHGVQRETEDRLLLERATTEPEFLESDPWRVLRIQSEFVEGFDALATVGPAVTFFGSARVHDDNPMYDAARPWRPNFPGQVLPSSPAAVRASWRPPTGAPVRGVGYRSGAT
jgi:hypothetical protein